MTCQWSPPPVKSCVSITDTGSAFDRVSLISSGVIIKKAYRFSAALATVLFQPGKGLTDWSLEIRPDFSHHCAQIHAQLIQSGPAKVPVTTVKIMNS